MSRIETALGLCKWPENSGTIDAGGGATEHALVVAEGISGHCTGWVGARLAIDAVLDAFGGGERAVNGAAGAFPDDWGWTGDHPRRTYAACAGDFGDLPRELGALVEDIDRVVRGVGKHASFDVLVGCIAATLDGPRVAGAHAGIGRAVLVRSGKAESLVVEHFWHLVADRVSIAGAEVVAEPPEGVIINGLGQLHHTNVGVDRFEIELAPGDVLVLSSRRLAIGDDELASLAARREPLDELARTIERRHSRGTTIAFALARTHD